MKTEEVVRDELEEALEGLLGSWADFKFVLARRRRWWPGDDAPYVDAVLGDVEVNLRELRQVVERKMPWKEDEEG